MSDFDPQSLLRRARDWRPPHDFQAVEAARNKQLPWSAERPFIFHCFTTLPTSSAGEQQFRDLVRRQAILAPASLRRDPERRAGWAEKAGATQLFGRDVAAGDDTYLFWKPLFPYTLSGPAIALDATHLPIYFRLQDLEEAYSLTVDRLGGECSEPDVDDDSGEVLTEYGCMSQELGEVAAAGTAYGTDAWELLIFFVRALHEETTIDHARPRFPRAWRDAVNELEGLTHDEDLDSVDQAVLEGIARIAWTRPFMARPKLTDPPVPTSKVEPEILVNTWIPITAAQFWRDWEGNWRPMDEIVDDPRQTKFPWRGFSDLSEAPVPIISPDPWMQKHPKRVQRLLEE